MRTSVPTPGTPPVALAATTTLQVPPARQTTPDPGFTTLKIPTVSEMIASAYDALKKIEEAAKDIMTNLKKAIEDAFGERVNKMDESITNLASEVEMIKNQSPSAVLVPGTGLSPEDLAKIAEITGQIEPLTRRLDDTERSYNDLSRKFDEMVKRQRGIENIMTWAEGINYPYPLPLNTILWILRWNDEDGYKRDKVVSYLQIEMSIGAFEEALINATGECKLTKTEITELTKPVRRGDKTMAKAIREYLGVDTTKSAAQEARRTAVETDTARLLSEFGINEQHSLIENALGIIEAAMPGLLESYNTPDYATKLDNLKTNLKVMTGGGE